MGGELIAQIFQTVCQHDCIFDTALAIGYTDQLADFFFGHGPIDTVKRNTLGHNFLKEYPAHGRGDDLSPINLT